MPSPETLVNKGQVAEAATRVRHGDEHAPWRDGALRVAFVVLLLAFWQATHLLLVARVGGAGEAKLFPAPLEVGAQLWNGFALTFLTGQYQPPPGAAMPTNFWAALCQADYPSGALISLRRLIEGYFIALALGFPLGFLLARSSLAQKTLGWLALSLQAMPSIGWAPLAILWFGAQSDAPVLFVTVAGSLFATMIAVSESMRQVPPLLSQAGRTLGASGSRLYFSVLLPAALPAILTGLKVGWSFAWRSLLAAELLVSAGGLGLLLQRDKNLKHAAGLFATILVIIAISLAVQALLFAPAERRLRILWGLSRARA
jgi:NitT/TauT family transport system permease protein